MSAAKHSVAIVGITHFTKAKGGSALSRVTGSFAFVAAARSVFTVMRSDRDPNQRIFAAAKNDLGRDAGALAFHVGQRITSNQIAAPYVVFA